MTLLILVIKISVVQHLSRLAYMLTQAGPFVYIDWCCLTSLLIIVFKNKNVFVGSIVLVLIPAVKFNWLVFLTIISSIAFLTLALYRNSR